MTDLKGQIAFVTAAGQGIGCAAAERQIADGAEGHASDLSDLRLLASNDARFITGQRINVDGGITI